MIEDLTRRVERLESRIERTDTDLQNTRQEYAVMRAEVRIYVDLMNTVKDQMEEISHSLHGHISTEESKRYQLLASAIVAAITSMSTLGVLIYAVIHAGGTP